MTHYNMIKETCSCGAKIDGEFPTVAGAMRFLNDWRASHMHYQPYRYPIWYGTTTTNPIPVNYPISTMGAATN